MPEKSVAQVLVEVQDEYRADERQFKMGQYHYTSVLTRVRNRLKEAGLLGDGE